MIRGDKDFKLKRKKGVILLVGGGDGSFKPALKTAKILLRQMNVDPIETILSLNTNITPSIEDCVALDKIKEIVKTLNQD